MLLGTYEGQAMTHREFEKFLQTQQTSSPINWELKLSEWQSQLKALYETVRVYLTPYLDAGKVKIQIQPKAISEDYIGAYQADSMFILLGSKTVMLEPVGTNIIGASGRVDIIGTVGSAMLLLVPRTQICTSRGSPREVPRCVIWSKSEKEMETTSAISLNEFSSANGGAPS
jgi:hypothetical protein